MMKDKYKTLFWNSQAEIMSMWGYLEEVDKVELMSSLNKIKDIENYDFEELEQSSWESYIRLLQKVYHKSKGKNKYFIYNNFIKKLPKSYFIYDLSEKRFHIVDNINRLVISFEKTNTLPSLEVTSKPLSLVFDYSKSLIYEISYCFTDKVERQMKLVSEGNGVYVFNDIKSKSFITYKHVKANFPDLFTNKIPNLECDYFKSKLDYITWLLLSSSKEAISVKTEEDFKLETLKLNTSDYFSIDLMKDINRLVNEEVNLWKQVVKGNDFKDLYKFYEEKNKTKEVQKNTNKQQTSKNDNKNNNKKDNKEKNKSNTKKESKKKGKKKSKKKNKTTTNKTNSEKTNTDKKKQNKTSNSKKKKKTNKIKKKKKSNTTTNKTNNEKTNANKKKQKRQKNESNTKKTLNTTNYKKIKNFINKQIALKKTLLAKQPNKKIDMYYGIDEKQLYLSFVKGLKTPSKINKLSYKNTNKLDCIYTMVHKHNSSNYHDGINQALSKYALLIALNLIERKDQKALNDVFIFNFKENVNLIRKLDSDFKTLKTLLTNKDKQLFNKKLNIKSKKKKNINVYVDGSFSNKENKIGSGVVFDLNNSLYEHSSGMNVSDRVLNNSTCAEVRSVVIAIHTSYLSGVSKITIHHDLNVLNPNFGENTYNKNKKSNTVLGLYYRYLKFIEPFIDVSFVKVKGHGKNRLHNKADKLASVNNF